MTTHQIPVESDEAASNHLPPRVRAPRLRRPKQPLKDRWQVLVLVPLVGAIVPLLHTLLETKRPARHDLIWHHNFAEAMYFGNVSLIEQQYQQATGRHLNERDLKKVEDAGKFAASKNFAAAASILSDVAQRAPVAAVYNNLGVAYANGDDFERAKKAFHDALRKDPDYKAAWVNIGLVQRKEGKLGEALGSFQKAPAFAMRQIRAIGEELKPKRVPAPSKPSPDQTAGTQPVKVIGDGHDILSPRSIALGVGRQDAVASGKPNYFRFVTPPIYRDLVSVSIANRSTALEPFIRVFNADKSDISGNQYRNTDGANLEYIFVVQPNSTYYVSMDGFNGTAGDYTLLVKPLKAHDTYEPNDDIIHASPVDLGKPIEANIMDKDDVDYYQFRSPVRAGSIEVSIANRSTTLTPLLRVFNADKSDISGNQYNNTAGGNLRYTFATQPNSSYYVAVNSFGGNAGDYTLTLKFQ